MKKHIIIMIANLVLASSLNASEGMGREHCFRPAFQKKLKRVKPIGLRSFNAMGKQNGAKKAVFIDWQKLYWGKLSDLVYCEEETYTNDVHEITGTEGQEIATLDSQDALSFAKELRQELKSFARQYGLKIVWRKKSLEVTDGTAAFLEYWDKGLSHEQQGKVLPFTELCALSTKDTHTGNTTAKAANVKDTTTKTLIKDVSFPNLFLKKGA